jgi:hypothetical protein
MHVHRSIGEPIRENPSWEQRWRGPDGGLIWCWERGRQKRAADPVAATRAERGELLISSVASLVSEEPILGWRGGVAEKLKMPVKLDGTLNYLAEWQGMRGEDLDVDTEGRRVIVCTKTGQAVMYSAVYPEDSPSP